MQKASKIRMLVAGRKINELYFSRWSIFWTAFGHDEKANNGSVLSFLYCFMLRFGFATLWFDYNPLGFLFYRLVQTWEGWVVLVCHVGCVEVHRALF